MTALMQFETKLQGLVFLVPVDITTHNPQSLYLQMAVQVLVTD